MNKSNSSVFPNDIDQALPQPNSATGSSHLLPIGTRNFQPPALNHSVRKNSCHSTLGSPYDHPFHSIPRYGIPAPPWMPFGSNVITGDRAMTPHTRSCGPFLVTGYRTSPRGTSRRDRDYLSGHHNVVDVARIRQGLDVRTTVIHALVVTFTTITKLA